ncbi:MAG: NADH-quinone oxidoreductase subunit L [Phycisphaerales bacterium]
MMMLSTTTSMLLEIAAPVEGPAWAGLIIWLPLISAMLCGICAAFKVRTKMPAVITCGLLGTAFVCTLFLYLAHEQGQPMHVHLFDWFNIIWGDGAQHSFVANFALYIDSLTLLWMLFVTGLGTLIAIYASEYMEPDVRGAGYARFFAGVSIFLFAMSCLVMGDNLVLLYLGWEGVGLASYLLIGYYYQRPSAVAAAKKAFIMNRIGDLGLALAIYLIYHNFGTVEYAELFAILEAGSYDAEAGGWSITAIPYLLMLGAFGKSAQLPLYVWLPDAMEGPTPVSALIHAATMVTAGVYLLARMLPMMLIEPYSLTVVAWVGGLTALLAATIGMAQYDIKRIMAYSTVSQLGYMFIGIGVLSTFGAAYHVFTHAFFKAVLFLTCGAIMHGFAGQLDLRKISGLRQMKGWKITSYTMLIGCLCLAGFPFTSGFFSKDTIIAEAFSKEHAILGWLALFTAGLTAYYTFRVWFRVCAGPVHYEPGDEGHGEDHGHDDGHGHEYEHGHGSFHPHAPRLAINAVLIIIALGAILAAIPYFLPAYGNGWVQQMVADSSAHAGVPVHDAAAEHGGQTDHAGHEAAHGKVFGFDPHVAMYYISGIIALIGIAIAWWFHLANRSAADALRNRLLASSATRWLPIAMERKWYVDEVYNGLIRLPLWFLGNLFALFDRIVIDMVIVDGVGRLPAWMGRMFRPLQSGFLHDYAKTMAGAAVLVLFFIWLMRSGAMDFLASAGGGR